jgi:hypothetical protein
MRILLQTFLAKWGIVSCGALALWWAIGHSSPWILVAVAVLVGVLGTLAYRAACRHLVNKISALSQTEWMELGYDWAMLVLVVMLGMTTTALYWHSVLVSMPDHERTATNAAFIDSWLIPAICSIPPLGSIFTLAAWPPKASQRA